MRVVIIIHLLRNTCSHKVKHAYTKTKITIKYASETGDEYRCQSSLRAMHGNTSLPECRLYLVSVDVIFTLSLVTSSRGNAKYCDYVSIDVRLFAYPQNHTFKHTHTHPFNGPFSGTTRVSRYQKGITNLDFTEARDSEWQWHQLDHMQVCILLQTDNHASTSSLSFLQAGCPSCRPTNSVKALKAPNVRTSANILCMLPTATARSSSDEAQQILYRSGIGV